jgi:hypothetical protein
MVFLLNMVAAPPFAASFATPLRCASASRREMRVNEREVGDVGSRDERAIVVGFGTTGSWRGCREEEKRARTD